MKKIIVKIILIIITAQTAAANIASLSTTEGMIEYLTPLPAVEKVRQWQNPYGQGVIIDSKHYRIRTTFLEPLVLKEMAAFMEAAHNAYNRQLPKPIQSNIKFDIYLFAHRDQWEKFTKEFAGPNWQLYLKIKKGAYYLNGVCAAYNIGRSRTFSVLAHEGWHQFSSRHFKYRLPSWLDEGIAQLFETSRRQNGRFIFEPTQNLSRLGALRMTLLSNNIIPTAELISLNPGQVLEHDDSSDKKVIAFYAQSYALVRFLREDDYGKRLERYHNMLGGAVDGTWPINEQQKKIASDRNIPLTVGWNRYIAQKLFDYYIEDDLALLEKQYLRFCRKSVYHIRQKK